MYQPKGDALFETGAPVNKPNNSLGYCPMCKAPNSRMERSIDGRTHCPNGHSFPHRDRLERV